LGARLSKEESYSGSLTARISTEESTRFSADESLTTRLSTEEFKQASITTALSVDLSNEVSTSASYNTRIDTFGPGSMVFEQAGTQPDGDIDTFQPTSAKLNLASSFIVTLNGLIQLQDEDYTYDDNGDTFGSITFPVAPLAGTRVGFIVFNQPTL
jgi:hypothetical protein